MLVGKNITIITDNDGNIQNNIIDKYSDYIDKDTIKICYEKNEELNKKQNNGVIDENIVIMTWFQFLLSDLVKPIKDQS